MSGNWTPENPGYGVPAEMRADAGRRQSHAGSLRSAAGAASSALGQATDAWQGLAAAALSLKSPRYLAELGVLADQADHHAAALLAYANEVESIQLEQTALKRSEADARRSLARVSRERADEQRSVANDPEGSRGEAYRLQAREESLRSELGRVSGQLAQLAARRSSADSAAVAKLTSAEARGGLAGFGATAGVFGQSHVSLGRMPSLDELNDLTEVELATVIAMHPELAATLAADVSPEQGAAWWATLTEGQQAALVVGAASLIGALPGMSPVIRSAANRVNAVHRERAIDSRLLELLPRVPGGPDAFLRSENHDEYRDLLAEKEYWSKVAAGEKQVYLYGPDNGALIEMAGDPLSAKSALFVVPGTNTAIKSFMSSNAFTAFAEYQVANADARGPVVAFTILAGPMPHLSLDPFDGPQNNAIATASGAKYARFVNEIHTTMPSLPTLSYEHSAGSQVGSAAEQNGAHFDIRYLAAGVGATDGFQANPDTKYFSAQAPDDINRYYGGLQLGGVGYGVGPEEFADIQLIDTGVSPEEAEENLRQIAIAAAVPGAGIAALPAVADLVASSIEHHNWLMSSDESLNGPILRSVRRELLSLGGAS